MPKLSKNVIGITGNIACGKSLVSDYLKTKGYYIIDADEITNDLYIKDNFEFKTGMINLFGNDILNLNNKIDKQKIAKIVFKDKEALKKLNELSHPIITKIISNLIKNSNENIIFVSAALLYEANWQENVDSVILVKCPRGSQIERLQKRNKYTLDEANKRIDSFLSQDIKAKLAKYVIDNDSTIENLYKKIDEIIEKIEKVK